jgi:hypothetical protein
MVFYIKIFVRLLCQEQLTEARRETLQMHSYYYSLKCDFELVAKCMGVLKYNHISSSSPLEHRGVYLLNKQDWVSQKRFCRPPQKINIQNCRAFKTY